MLKAFRIMGLLTTAEGFLIATFAKDYLKIWRTDKFGPGFRRGIDAYLSLPDNTFRLTGFATMLFGATLVLLTERAEEEAG